MDDTGTLSKEMLQSFRDRFGTFHDAIVYSVTYHIFRAEKHAKKKLEVVLGFYDLSRKENKWERVVLRFIGVDHLTLNDPINYEASIIFKLHASVFDDKVHFNFFTSGSTPDDRDEYVVSDLRGSKLLIIAEECHWEVSEDIIEDR